MRRVRLIALMTALIALFCASCAAGGGLAQQKALEIRTELLEAETVTAVAEMTADYGEKVYEYKIKYTGDGESGIIEIYEPEELAGLSARAADGGAVLEYDGASLETGPLTKNGLSPAAALPKLIAEWRSGYVTGSVLESCGGVSAVAVTVMVSPEVELRTWFDAETHFPLRAELAEDGRTVITCVFENVTLG